MFFISDIARVKYIFHIKHHLSEVYVLCRTLHEWSIFFMSIVAWVTCDSAETPGFRLSKVGSWKPTYGHITYIDVCLGETKTNLSWSCCHNLTYNSSYHDNYLPTNDHNVATMASPTTESQRHSAFFYLYDDDGLCDHQRVTTTLWCVSFLIRRQWRPLQPPTSHDDWLLCFISFYNDYDGLYSHHRFMTICCCISFLFTTTMASTTNDDSLQSMWYTPCSEHGFLPKTP